MKKIYLITFIILASIYLFYSNGNQPRTETTSVEQYEEEEDAALSAENNATKPQRENNTDLKNNPHLKFKGVPIDGTLKQFIERMKQQGFKYIDNTSDGTATLKGDFAAYKGCYIYVYTLEHIDLVSRISVVFPKQAQWQGLYGNYKNLKTLLTKKYGDPASCTEKFQASYYDTDDSSRISGVKSDYCKYSTSFNAPNGKIILSIEHQGYSSCFVMLTYSDKANSNIIKQHAIEDL